MYTYIILLLYLVTLGYKIIGIILITLLQKVSNKTYWLID